MLKKQSLAVASAFETCLNNTFTYIEFNGKTYLMSVIEVDPTKVDKENFEQTFN